MTSRMAMTVALVSAISLTPTTAAAQPIGSVTGAVVDEHDMPLGGVLVSLPALQRSTTTDSGGRFAFRGLPATALVVEARRLGYRASAQRIDLSQARTLALTIKVSRSAVTVSEVVVTGSATANERRGAQDVAALGDAALRATSTGSLGRTLEKLPGVSNMSGGPASGNPVLRGLSQSRIRIVRDGIPQESFEASPRWFPPGNLSAVDRIEVIRGPASILYGSNAIGGAINIVPRALPVSETHTLRVLGLVESQYFSNNDERYAHGEVAIAQRAFGARAGGARRVANAFRTPVVTPFAESQVQGAPRITGRIPFSNYEQSSYYGQAGVSGTWGNVRALYDGWDGYNNFPNANGKPAGVHAGNDDIRVQGNIIAGRFVFRSSVVAQKVRIERAASIAKRYEVASDSALWDQRLVNNVFTARFEASHPPIARLQGTVGAEYSRQRSVTKLSQIQPSGSIENAALFIVEDYRVHALTLSVGARGDTRVQHAVAGSLVNALPVDEREDALRQQFGVVTGSVGAAYQLTQGLSASVNVGTGFRAPSFLDLYTNENRPALSGWVEGNPHVVPERSRSAETGVHYSGNRLTLGVVAYRNAISNFTYLSRTTRTHASGSTNVPVYTTLQTDARIAGFEPSASAEVVRGVVVESNYARIRSRNLTTGEQLPLMPADQFRGGVRFVPKAVRRIESPYVQVGLKHAWAKRIAGPTEPFADGGLQGYGVGSTVAYSLVDIGAGGRVTLGGSAIEVHVTVDNLLNEAYRDFLDSQKGFTLGAGRNVGVRVAAPLNLSR